MAENKKLNAFDEFKELLEKHEPNGLYLIDTDEIVKIVMDEETNREEYNGKVREAIERIINDENYKDSIPFEIKAAFIDYHIKNSDKNKAVECITKTIPAKDVISNLLLYYNVLIKEKEYTEATKLLFNNKDIDKLLEENEFANKTYTAKIYLSCVQKEIENIISDANNKFNHMKEVILNEGKGEKDIDNIKSGIEKNKRKKIFSILKKMSEFLNKIEGRFPEIVEKKDKNNMNVFMKFEDELVNKLNINYTDLPNELFETFAKKGDEQSLSFFLQRFKPPFTKEVEEQQLNAINDCCENNIKNISNKAILLKYSALILKNENIENEKIASGLERMRDKMSEDRKKGNKGFSLAEITRFYKDCIAKDVSVDRIEKYKNILEEIRKLSGYDKSIETILEEKRKTNEVVTDRVSKYCTNKKVSTERSFS